MGGAANVARQLAALGVKVSLGGAVGNDLAGGILKELCEKENIATLGIVTLGERPTTRKLRVLGQNQQLLRIDWEEAAPLSLRQGNQFLEQVGPLMGAAPVILSDYAKGLLSDEVLRRIRDSDVAGFRPILIDPKRKNFKDYRGARILTPNLRELATAVGRPLTPKNLDDIAAAAREQRALGDFEAIVVTLGDLGMLAVAADGSDTLISAVKRPVYDVTGAGDTAAAVLGAALSTGASLLEAASLANTAAGIAVGELGAAAVTPAQVREALSGQTLLKILGRAEIEARAAHWRAAGRQVVFTNGCFDLLHPGHLAPDLREILGGYSGTRDQQ